MKIGTVLLITSIIFYILGVFTGSDVFWVIGTFTILFSLLLK